MSENVFEICRVVAVLIGLVIAYYIVPVLKILIERHVDENITDFITSCVYAAQQTITDNKEKKQFVLDRVTAWLKSKNIEINPEQLDILIESAVLAMKTETK